ncbi:MAG TPA: hypothetical protein VIL28_09415, partial [Steroidobacteraceae bacterium]
AYMLILQTDDLARDRARVERLGVRIVWQSNLREISAIQLHPKDIGAAIVSLDEPRPPNSWHWAGPEWRRYVPRDGALRVVEATIAAHDPQAMAQRWGTVLGLGGPTEINDAWRLDLEGGALRFVRTDEDERIVRYSLIGPREQTVTICGTEFAVARNPA